MAIFTNQATLTYNNTVTNSNIASGQILEVITATKTAVGSNYSANGQVTYVLSIMNSGSVPFSGLTVTDDLGAYTLGDTTLYPITYTEGSLKYFVNGVLTPSPSSVTSPPLVLSGITIPAGGNVIIVYEGTVNGTAPLDDGSVITNTATVTGGGISVPVTASAQISVSSEPFLTISKSISPSPVAENSRVTYTFVIQNTGNTEADEEDAVSVSDIFDPILTDITVTLNGEAFTSYTYDETTGDFVTAPGSITVPAAVYTQSEETGVWTATPGTAVLTVTGTI